MNIERINTYQDRRFSQRVLRQHGAFLVDGSPYEIEILGPREAVVRGDEPAAFPELIEAFRLYTPHISAFYDINGSVIQSYEASALFQLELSQIQPSQFFVDQEKLAAVSTILRSADQVVIPVLRDGECYISLDGHTRLFLAVQRGWSKAWAIEDEAGDYIHAFAAEARRRGIYTPYDLKLLSHERYRIKWDGFCDRFFREVQEE